MRISLKLQRALLLCLVHVGFLGAVSMTYAQAPEAGEGYVGCSVVLNDAAGLPKIDYVAKGSPAAAAAIKLGDEVVMINDLYTSGRSVTELKHAIDGPVGTTAHLLLRRAGVPDLEVSVVRRPVLDVYTPGAAAGEPKAEYALGWYYERGPVSSRDQAKAVGWFRKSAEGHFALAELELGHLVTNGLGTQKDLKAGADWYLKAAQQDNATAEMYLGFCFLNGQGVPQSDQNAFAWMYRSAQQDKARAQAQLASLYLHGRGVAQNDRAAFSWYYRSASLYDAYGQWGLAHMYGAGKGVPEDRAEALNWYLQAAAKLPGDVRLQEAIAQVSLRVLAQQPGAVSTLDAPITREGAPTSNQSEFEQALQGAQQDNAASESNLAFLYLKGRGVDRDDQAAFTWYYRSAVLDDPYGQWGVGYMYATGRGVKADRQEALRWYAKAEAKLPTNARLKENIAWARSQLLAQDPSYLFTLAPADFPPAVKRWIRPSFFIFGTLYLLGGAVLLYSSLRSSAACEKVFISLGWISFYVESQGFALFGLFILGVPAHTSTLLGAMALATALPVILSSCGPLRARLWQRPTASLKRMLVYCLLAYVVVAIVGVACNEVYLLVSHSSLPRQYTAELFTRARNTSAWITYATVALLLPITEEIIFRGYLFEAARRYLSDRKVVLVTALIFAAFHLEWLYFVPLATLGLILGWMRTRTGSLWLPAVFHMVNNGIFLATSN